MCDYLNWNRTKAFCKLAKDETPVFMNFCCLKTGF